MTKSKTKVIDLEKVKDKDFALYSVPKIRPLTKKEGMEDVKSLEALADRYKNNPPQPLTRFEQQSDEYKVMLDDIYLMFLKKGHDYGCKEDHYDNIRKSAKAWLPAEYPAWVSALIRQGDKLIRIQNFLKNGKLENESVEDSLRDNAVYALNALAMYLEGKK